MVVGYVCSGVFQKEDLLSGTLLFSSLSSISYKHIVPLFMVQWSTHCEAYHNVYRFGHLKVMEPMFMFPTSTIKDPVFTENNQNKV